MARRCGILLLLAVFQPWIAYCQEVAPKGVHQLSLASLNLNQASSEALAKPNYAEASLAKADASAVALAKADSLFHLKQYTQSLELYTQLFNNHQYSPSMLVKMAYIQEGLGHLAQSLYFLNLYYLATSDTKVLAKLEEVAKKNNLSGYNDSDTSRIEIALKENAPSIALGLVAAGVLLLVLAVYQKLKKQIRPVGAVIGLACVLIGLFVFNFWSSSHGQGIVAGPSTYLMSGPSSGSGVVSIVGEGNRLEILGQNDVWLKVVWNEQEVFVKESELLPVKL
jgi:hypothetical protein